MVLLPGDSMSWFNFTGIGQTEEIVCFAASFMQTVFFFFFYALVFSV